MPLSRANRAPSLRARVDGAVRRVRRAVPRWRYTRIARIDGVDVYVHWSAFALAALLIGLALPKPQGQAVVLASLLGLVLLHEWGHVIAARHFRCVVQSIELYPLWGVTRHTAPASHFALCAIAWGGVLAQMTVAIPVLLWVTFGPAIESGSASDVLGVFGTLSLFLAIFNLLPFRPLDGSRAWSLLPMLLSRALARWLRARENKARSKVTRLKPRKWVH